MADKQDRTTQALDPALVEALALGLAPVQPDAGAILRMREKLFQRIREPEPEFRFVHSHEGEWVRLLAGVEMKLLRQDNHSRSLLLRMRPGSRIPPHEHELEEESLVLEGDATINGVLCRAGDYHMAPRGKPHGWVSTEGGCLLFLRGASDQHAHSQA
jgi:anti-sigma factor ChrR (cupin superfamily)